MSDGNTAQEMRTTTTPTTTTSAPGPTSNEQGLGERMRPILKGMSFEDGQAALMPPPDPSDTGPGPLDLSPPAEDLFDEAELALGRVKAKTRKAGRLPVRRGTALEVLRRLGQADPKVRQEVVAALDADGGLRALIKTATPKAIWADEAAADALLEVLRVRDPAQCKDDIVELTKVQVKLFRKDGGKWVDAGANRWEARVAWEMLLILPDAEREALLAGPAAAVDNQVAGPDAENDAKVSGALAKAERNMSNEYKNSSRFDTYAGNAAKETAVDASTNGVASEAGRTPTTEDTDRQALLASAIDPELWESAPTERLKGVLRMVIQADEAAVVAPLVKQHWKAHSGLLSSLGFAEDGTWSEKIVDQTASTWFGRAIAATTAISQAIGVLFGALAGRVRFKGEIDLQALCKGFPNMAGLQLKPHERPTDPAAILGYALGGIGPVKQILKWCGVPSEAELLQALTEAKHAGKWLLRKLAEAGAVAEGLADLEALLDDKGKGGKDDRDKGKENMLVVEANGLSGEKRIAIPALEIAATSRRSGTSLLKTGASSLYGIELAFKGRTAFDQKRSVSVKVGAIHIGQLLKTDPQGMVALESLDLGGMTLELESPETNPATWLEKLRDLVIHIASRVIEMMPFKGAALGAKALRFGVVATRAFLEGTALMRDAASIVAKLGAIDAAGFVQSDGGHLDKLSVGESELSVKDPNGLGMHLGNELEERGDYRIKREHDRAVREQERSAKKIERAKDKGKDERVKKLEERKAQAARVEERTATTLSDRRDLRAVDAEITKAKAELEAASAGNDPAAKEKAEGRLKELQIERAMVETRRLEVEGHIGAIDVQGMDMGGTKVASLHVAKTEIGLDKGSDKRELGDKGDQGKDHGGAPDKGNTTATTESRKLSVTNAEITMSGVELSQDRRRDVAIKMELEQLRSSLATPKDPAQEISQDQRDATQKRINALWIEQRELEPVVTEYELLRSRLRELDEDDRARFLELRKQLESPTTTKVDKVEVKNLALSVDVTSEVTRTDGAGGAPAKDQHSAVDAKASIGHIGVHGLAMKDDARGAVGGDQSVKSITADHLKVSAMGDLEALLAGRATEQAGGGLSLERAEVKDIKIEGARDEATRQIAANAQTRTRLEAEIARVQQKAKPASTDPAQIAALRAQLEGLAAEDARLTQEHVAVRPRLLALASAIEARKKDLVSNAIDLSRATSLDALIAQATTARKAAGEVDSKTLRGRIAQYDAGIAALEAEIKEVQWVKSYHGDGTGFDYDAKGKLACDTAVAERQAIIARAKEARTADLKALGDLFTARKKLEAQAAEVERVRDVYADLVATARAGGLEPIARANALTLEGISAFQMGKLATVAANAGESLTVDRIAIDGLELEGHGKTLPAPTDKTGEVEGKAAEPDTKDGKGGTLGVDTKTSGSLTIEGVKTGDQTMIGKLSVQGLGGGLSYDPKDNAVILDKFGVNSIGLSSLDWETGTMGVKAPEPIGLKELRVSGRIKLGGAKNVLDRIDIGSMSSGALEFRYADYLLGAKQGGSLGMKGVELCHVDLQTYDFGLDAQEVSAEKLAIDLGQGMELGAKSLKTGLSVGALVADGKYDIQLADLAAEDFDFKMKSMGVGVNIAKIAGGKGAISTDLTKGDYNVDVDLKKLGLGPISYAADGMVFDTKSGLDCDDVHLKVTVKTDAQGEMHIKVDHVGAKHAQIPFVNLAMGSGKSAQTITVKDASVDALNLRNLDLDTMTLELDAKNLDAKSLAMKMDGMDLQTSAHVGSLDFKMLKNDKGEDVMDLAFGKASLGGTVNMGMKDPTKSDGTLLGLDVKNAAGKLRMEGDTTSFSGVHVASAGLPKVLWRGGGATFEGKGIAAKGVKADGHYRSYDKPVRGMMLPATDLVVTRLHIDEVTGTSLAYNDPASGMAVTPDPRNPGKQMTLTDLDVIDLKMIDGVMQDGKITLEKAVVGGKVGLEKMGALGLSGAIEGEGLFCNFKDGATDFGARKVALKNVHGEMGLGVGNKDKLEFDAPEIYTSVIEGSTLSKYTEEGLDGHVQSASKVWVESLHIPEDVKAKYHLWEGDWKRGRTNQQIANNRELQENELSSEELVEKNAGERQKNLSMEKLRPALAGLLARCNADLSVGAEMAMDGKTLVKGMPRLKIDDGALDTGALLASLGTTELLGMKILPTQDLRIYTVGEGDTFSVRVEMSTQLIGKLGLLLVAASPFMPMLGGAAGAWLGQKYGSSLGADMAAAFEGMSAHDQAAWLARAGARTSAEKGGMLGGAMVGALTGQFLMPAITLFGLMGSAVPAIVPFGSVGFDVGKEGRSRELPKGYNPSAGDSVPLATALSYLVAEPAKIEALLALRRYAPDFEINAVLTKIQRDRFTRETLDAMDTIVEAKAELEKELAFWQKAIAEREKSREKPPVDPSDPYAHFANDPRNQVKQDGYLAHIEAEKEKAPLSSLAAIQEQTRIFDAIHREMKTTLRAMGVDIKEDAGASNFALQIGPMRGFIELGRIDAKESYDLLGTELTMDHLRLGINEQVGEGIFGGRLQMDQLGIKQKTATGGMEAKLGYADLGFDGLQDKYGFVTAMGKDMPNPLEGKIKRGSKLENLSLSFETDAKAQVRAHKGARKK